MGRIPQSFIDELLARADIVEVVDECVPLRKQGSNHKARCPFHEERTPSFNVSSDRQIYHCFGCGAGGNAIGFLMEYEHLSFPEAVRELAGRYGLEVPEEAGPAGGGTGSDTGSGTAESKQDIAALQRISERAARYFEYQLRNHSDAAAVHDYLRGRGITGETAARFRLGFAPAGWRNLLEALGGEASSRKALEEVGLIVDRGSSAYDRFRNRLMFPIRDRRGRVIAFGGRVLDDAEPKYLNSPEGPLFQKGRELYGLYEARQAIRREDRALVVEGYMDVIALAEAGVDNAVAPLGTALTGDQLRLLLRTVPEVTLAFDGDEAGREAAWRTVATALPEAGRGRTLSFLFLPEGEDPDSLVRAEGPEGFHQRIENATPLFEFLIRGLKAEVDLTVPEGRDRLLEKAGPLYGRIRDAKLRDLLVQRLNGIVKLDYKRVVQHLEQNRERERPSREQAGGSSQKSQDPLAGQKIIRKALWLFLENPQSLAKDVLAASEDLKRYRTEGTDILLAASEVVQENPDISTGILVERLRGMPSGDSLHHIVGKGPEVPLPPDEHRADFLACLRKLQIHAIKARKAALEEEAQSGWTREQEKEFRELRQQEKNLDKANSSETGLA